MEKLGADDMLKYKPIPFWSWNEKLDTSETKEQIRKMREAGIGGFFMHARGGLQTEYMSKEWFENVDAAIEEAKKLGMRPWAYDENGWPSGFGNGAVNGMGVAYQQKHLKMEDEKEHTENAICKSGNHYFYYETNPFYVDLLDKKVVAKFIEVAYKPYYERYGNDIEGFFTDEPQISRDGIPWSFVFEKEYKKRYQVNLLEHLEELFLPVGEYRLTRVRFWKMVTELFSEAYMKQIYEWCCERGLKLTGHLTYEEDLYNEMICNGACMPHYEYFHIPGMDWLERKTERCLTPIQVSSVSEQLGKEAVLSETFALCGHNVSFAELKGIYEWQMVHGINLLCQHLEGYSIRGIRKRDYPPAMYIQQPWWSEYSIFNDAMSRIGKLLTDGFHPVDVLVIHPQTTAWSMYDGGEGEDIKRLNAKMIDILNILEEKHIAYHLGDEIIMERHGSVKNGKLIIGKCAYTYVIDSCCEILCENTKKLLDEFKKQGGRIVSEDELSDNNVINNPKITYTERIYDNYRVHYFVNTSAKSEEAVIPLKAKKMDIYTGELYDFYGKHTFEPWGSLILVEAGDDDTKAEPVEETIIYPNEELYILKENINCLTLDMCDYYFDGELQEKNGYVLNIAERANALERKVKIHQDYHVNIDYIPESLYLVCETPEKFTIMINGIIIEKKISGYFADKSFKKIQIADYLKQGENSISFDCDFVQNEQFYNNLRNAYFFEAEKNKLVYDMEIEAIYLVGDFSVRTDGQWKNLERSAQRYKGNFVIDKPKQKINIRHIEKQGYPFFCGRLLAEGKLNIEGENPVLEINRKGINCVGVEINGIQKWMLASDKLSLKDFGVYGMVNVKYTLVNNLRNMLGPHHLEIGESYHVGPFSFFKESCIWSCSPEKWNEDYCLAEMSLSNKSCTIDR